MANIYLSSTFVDLELHRAAVCRQLQRMQHSVKAMEDYVARDDRPVDACLADVRASDLYVGLFAWRYGHVPKARNPKKRSITEMEYRAAEQAKIPRLVFLLDENATWLPRMLDSHTGDAESGARIRALRAELSEGRLASTFTTPDDLAAKVAASVHLANTVSDASDASTDLAQIVGADVVDQDLLINQSYVPYLVSRLSTLGSAKLVKIDLRDDRHWWSTRLFAMATLLHTYSNVEWLLFLENGTDFVGMIRPGELRKGLLDVQPDLDNPARMGVPPDIPAGTPFENRAGLMLEAMVAGFRAYPGDEVALKVVVDSAWLKAHVPGLLTSSVERAGDFDPLATYELLRQPTPFVAITDRGRLVKVVDRIGVATELATTVVERRIGRR